VETEQKKVVLDGGGILPYDLLVIASGCQPHPEETAGLLGAHWRDTVHDFYTLEGALALRSKLETFPGGRLVMNIVEMPIKCPVAPLEFIFLADEYFTRRGIRDRVELVFTTPLDGCFTKPVASATLRHLLDEKKIEVEPQFNASEVDGERRSFSSDPLLPAREESTMNRFTQNLLIVLLAVVFLGVLAGPAGATNGMFLTSYGAETAGRDGANIAVADRTLALNFNPAGIAQLQGQHFSLNLAVLAPQLKFENGLNGETDAKGRYFPLPAFAYVRSRPGSPWSWGLGFLAQGGMGATFQNLRTPFGTRDETYSEVRFGTLTPTVAYAINPDMALGASVNIGYADASFRFFPHTSFFNAQDPANSFFGAAMNKAGGLQTSERVGWWWRANQKLSFGAIYQTETKSKFDGGDMRINFIAHPQLGREVHYDATLDGFTFAAQVGAGMAYRPTPDWVLAFDVKPVLLGSRHQHRHRHRHESRRAGCAVRSRAAVRLQLERPVGLRAGRRLAADPGPDPPRRLQLRRKPGAERHPDAALPGHDRAAPERRRRLAARQHHLRLRDRARFQQERHERQPRSPDQSFRSRRPRGPCAVDRELRRLLGDGSLERNTPRKPHVSPPSCSPPSPFSTSRAVPRPRAQAATNSVPARRSSLPPAAVSCAW
jgi:hypothetical protein